MDWQALGTQPISDEHPAGADIRYEPEFEELQTEIDKLSIPSASGSIDWEKVSRLAATILSAQSKDLLVASYLAVSQVHLRRIDGLNDGLSLLHDLIEGFWDHLFPPKKRMRGRLGAIEWWIEKTEGALQSIAVSSLPDTQLQSVIALLKQLDGLLIEHLPEPPLLRPIQRLIEQIPAKEAPSAETETQTAAPPPVEAPAAEAVSAPPPVPPAAAEPPAEQITAEDAVGQIDTALQMIQRAAAILLEKDAKAPAPYRFRRLALWSKVMAPPPSSEGRTQLPPPAPQVLEPLEELRNAENWLALINSAEPKLSQFRFWIDLNRYVADALHNLGEAYQDAYDAVCQETAILIQRIPELIELHFSDGRPFADKTTREWVQTISLGGEAITLEATSAPETETGDNAIDPLTETVKKAQGLVKKKKLMEAVTLLQSQLPLLQSGHETLQWRMALSHMLLAARRSELARPHLDLIIKDIERHDLEKWDPVLALQAYKLVWNGYKRQTQKTLQQRAEEIVARIAQLDAAEALRLAKKK